MRSRVFAKTSAGGFRNGARTSSGAEIVVVDASIDDLRSTSPLALASALASAAASSSARTTTRLATASSPHRSRLPFSNVRLYSVTPRASCVATTHRCSPRLGISDVSAHVHPSPTTCRVAFAAADAAARPERRTPRAYAAAARSRAVVDETYRRGSVPPSASIVASRPYGTRASRSVRDAPGTAATHPRDCAAPPVTWRTARTGEAWTASTAARSAGSMTAPARERDARASTVAGTTTSGTGRRRARRDEKPGAPRAIGRSDGD
eukprot:31296-Pelagococcus_subviridis.AAC.4